MLYLLVYRGTLVGLAEAAAYGEQYIKVEL